MKDIERRVVKLENCLGSSLEPETLEEMIATFEDNNVMGAVVAILHDGNGESLKKHFPAELVNFFIETLKRKERNEGPCRERREGESEKDYLAYKILECKAIAGYPELR